MSDSSDLPRIHRRRLLNGAAVLGVAAPVLAACGSDEPTTTSTATSPPDSGTPSSGGEEGNAGGNAGGGGGAELVPTADVPVGGGVVLDAEKVVVTQPVEGEFKAFSAVCTHQGCLVGAVEDNTINCPCHGSQFSAEDGSVITGPANGPLSPVEVSVQGGSVVSS